MLGCKGVFALFRCLTRWVKAAERPKKCSSYLKSCFRFSGFSEAGAQEMEIDVSITCRARIGSVFLLYPFTRWTLIWGRQRMISRPQVRRCNPTGHLTSHVAVNVSTPEAGNRVPHVRRRFRFQDPRQMPVEPRTHLGPVRFSQANSEPHNSGITKKVA